MPEASFMLEEGQWAMAAPRSTSSWRSESVSQTPWAPMKRLVQEAFGVEDLDGGLAGGLDAFVGFALRFGNVGLDDEVVGRGEIAADGAHFGGGGVEGVDADGKVDAGGVGAGQGEVLLEVAAEAVEGFRAGGDDVGMAEIGADAAFIEGAEALGGLPIHVEDGGDAGADHFEAAEEGAPVDVVGGEAALHGPDDVVEPLVEGESIAEAAHEDHGGMAMDVGEGGQDGQWPVPSSVWGGRGSGCPGWWSRDGRFG
jgi:hypothetical protein